MTVVSLYGHEPKTSEPDPDIIAELEECLSRAKAGDLAGLALVGIRRGGGGAVTSFNFPAECILEAVGGLEAIKLRLLVLCHED